ncbi:MAG: helix-turn-helix domain-containing protein [Sandaracinaceae bacterium]|nr:helix-turn-helix domain-containing protein [Sandaracinaceae bacterium]
MRRNIKPGAARVASTFDSRAIPLLERIAVAIEGLRCEHREDLGSLVDAFRESSNGRDVDTNNDARAEFDPLQLLTLGEVTKLLAIDGRTLRELRNAGDAPPEISVGKRPRWRRSDVEAWLKERKAS